MFTGIVTDLGRVRDIRSEGDTRIEIATAYEMALVPIGASIACSGVCLTVIERQEGWFAVQASAETLACTTLGAWRKGTRVNLERALKVGDELGGHLVSGHVDGVGEVLRFDPVGDNRLLEIRAPAALARYIARKGSITVDGVSLTTNSVDGAAFSINLIPHTLDATTLGRLQPGNRVNLEIDLIARYVERMLGAPNGEPAGITAAIG